jgi:7-carboxy-7-deazaguanine synthase
MGPVSLFVNEIFHSIQGESSHTGRPCVFVRLTGCNLRCTWCDTAYAFHEGQQMALDEVVDRVRAYGCRLVEVTGGEPLLQSDVVPLMERLVAVGYEVLLETGGSLSIAQVPEGVKRIVDVKCPGSGEAERNDWGNLKHLGEGDELKFVLADRDDYLWAREQIARRGLDRLATLLFSAVHETLDPAEMAGWILEDRLTVRAQVQLHKVLWPAATRGV